MTTIHETYDEQHVQAVIVYGKETDEKLYEDADYTTKAAQDELLSLFKKKLLLIAGGNTLYVPVAAGPGGIVTVDYNGSTAVWNAPEN